MQNLNTRLNTLRKTPKFHGDLDLKNILELIKKHETYKIRYQLLYDYFIGKHCILTREIAKSKPNNRIIDLYIFGPVYAKKEHLDNQYHYKSD